MRDSGDTPAYGVAKVSEQPVGLRSLEFRHNGKCPIFYSSRYTPNFSAIGRSHPSEVRAPTAIFTEFCTQLHAAGVAVSPADFLEPEPLRDDEILLVHPPALLESLNRVETIARVLSIPALQKNTIQQLHEHIVSAQRSCGGGTRSGLQHALHRGWSINLKGGLHHAKRDHGEGFCFFSDIAIALAVQRRIAALNDILIVDLDAHQGNGTAFLLGDDPAVRILDVFNRDIYPRDAAVLERVTFAYPLPSMTADDVYLAAVQDGLDRAFQQRRPQLVLYIAGTDIIEDDPLGKLAVSREGIFERDRRVWLAAIRNRVPIFMVLAGGYAPQAGALAGQCAAHCVLQFTNARPNGF